MGGVEWVTDIATQFGSNSSLILLVPFGGAKFLRLQELIASNFRQIWAASN